MMIFLIIVFYQRSVSRVGFLPYFILGQLAPQHAVDPAGVKQYDR
jgi:hypothetical protein